ncbi:MAG: alcohol dehydrogenase catalytic domain-containing protein [Firmicutes bacterium]|nr:alcohol dehydrogenase catalytic domain-containing protein [Bacillota bacterium]
MKGWMVKGPGNLELVSARKPRPAAGELLVRVNRVGICGSDVHLYHGTYRGPHRYPLFFGHEWSGAVEGLGEGVRGFEVGDLVTGDCSQWCGACEMCPADRNLCLSIEKTGITIDGASREYMTVKASHAYRANGCDPGLLASAEPLAVAAHACERVVRAAGGDWAAAETPSAEVAGVAAGLSPGGSHRCGAPLFGRGLVMGSGAVGLAVTMFLIDRGVVGSLDVLDVQPFRLEVASSLGARALTPEDLGGPAAAPATGAGGSSYRDAYAAAQYDLVVETTGTEPGFSTALSVARPNASLALIGFLPKAGYEMRTVVTKALKIVGSIGGTGNFPDALDLLRRKPEFVRKMVSHVFTMSEAEEAFRVATDTARAIKVQIDFGSLGT